MKKGLIYPKCKTCKHSIMKLLDGRMVQKATSIIKELWLCRTCELKVNRI